MRNDPIEHIIRQMLARNQSRWQRPTHELGSRARKKQPEREYFHSWKGYAADTRPVQTKGE